MIQSLSILEQAVGEEPEFGAPLLHAMAESWKGPFLDRQRYFGDPDQVILPIAGMLSPSRIQKRAALAGDGKVHPSSDYDLPVEWVGRPATTPILPAAPAWEGISDRPSHRASIRESWAARYWLS